MILGSGALQSEPVTIIPSNASVASTESEDSTPLVGNSSAVRQTHSLPGEDRAAVSRRATFPVERVDRS